MKRPPTPTVPWLRAGALSGLRELADQLGQKPEPMLQRFGLPLAMLDDPELRVPYANACQFLEGCAEEWHCPDFGLRLGQAQHLEILGPIGLIARLTDTVGDALAALCGHMNVHTSGVTLSLRVDDANARSPALAQVAYTPRPRASAGRQKLELSMAAVCNIVALVCGRPEFTALAVHFACPPPRDTAPSQAFFRCPVRYGETETALRFSPEILALPTAIRDPAIEPLVFGYMDRLQDQLGDDIVAAVCSLIGTLLSSGRCTREAVADCLNLHPRTLQRRLEAAGTSFSLLLDDYRRTLAMELLERGSLPLVQVADALGYADQSVFNQAFRRWTATTPTAYRN